MIGVSQYNGVWNIHGLSRRSNTLQTQTLHRGEGDDKSVDWWRPPKWRPARSATVAKEGNERVGTRNERIYLAPIDNTPKEIRSQHESSQLSSRVSIKSSAESATKTADFLLININKK